MTLIEKSRNYNCEEIVKQETIKAFYDKLYETFNSRPYLYDICKNILNSLCAQNYLQDNINLI